jgi:hypothetical protein
VSEVRLMGQTVVGMGWVWGYEGAVLCCVGGRLVGVRQQMMRCM